MTTLKCESGEHNDLPGLSLGRCAQLTGGPGLLVQLLWELWRGCGWSGIDRRTAHQIIGYLSTDLHTAQIARREGNHPCPQSARYPAYALSRMSRLRSADCRMDQRVRMFLDGLARQPGDAISMVATTVGCLVLDQRELMGPEPATS